MSARQCQICVLQEARAAQDDVLQSLRAHSDVLGEEAAERDAAPMGRVPVASLGQGACGKRRLRQRRAALRQGEEAKIGGRAGERLAGALEESDWSRWLVARSRLSTASRRRGAVAPKAGVPSFMSRATVARMAAICARTVSPPRGAACG
jgi:hypothetical protein